MGLSLEFDRLCDLGHCMKVGTQLMNLNDEIFLGFFLVFLMVEWRCGSVSVLPCHGGVYVVVAVVMVNGDGGVEDGRVY